MKVIVIVIIAWNKPTNLENRYGEPAIQEIFVKIQTTGETDLKCLGDLKILDISENHVLPPVSKTH